MLDGDTLITMTPLQLKKANKIFAKTTFLEDKIALIESDHNLTKEQLKISEERSEALQEECLQCIEESKEDRQEIEDISEELIKQKAKSQRRGLGLLGTIGIIILLAL